MRAAWASSRPTVTRTPPAAPSDGRRSPRTAVVLSLVAPRPKVSTDFASRHHCSFWADSDSMKGRSATTPLGALARGVAAGACGTAAMDAFLYTRYRREGGAVTFRRWEAPARWTGWAHAPAPAQVGRRLIEGLFDRTLGPERAPLINTLTHWGFGTLAASQYGVVAGSMRRPSPRSATASPSARPSGRAGTWSCPRRGCTADLGVRPRQPRQGSRCPPHLRGRHGRRPMVAFAPPRRAGLTASHGSGGPASR